MSLFEQPDGSALRGQLLGNLEGMQEWEHLCLFVYMSVSVCWGLFRRYSIRDRTAGGTVFVCIIHERV